MVDGDESPPIHTNKEGIKLAFHQSFQSNLSMKQYMIVETLKRRRKTKMSPTLEYFTKLPTLSIHDSDDGVSRERDREGGREGGGERGRGREREGEREGGGERGRGRERERERERERKRRKK